MKYKRQLAPAVILVITLFMSAGSIFAQSSKEHGRSVEEIIKEIRQELNIGAEENINPGRVNDKLLEQLGEAVMSYMVPDNREHGWMDNMMGGEGSESLANMHRIMGYRYLRDGNISFGPMMGGMSGRGFRGSMMGEGVFGEGWSYWVRSYGFWLILFVILSLIAAMIVLVVLSLKRRRGEMITPMDALEILKQSYAKGEINREEYMRMKNDLLD